MELEVDGYPLEGEFLRSAKLVNTMIEQLAIFTSEVTRVARFEGDTKAVIELATVRRFTDGNLAFLDQLTVNIGAVFHTIEATMRTEGLLEQSQQLTVQLQSRQGELQRTNEELAAQASLLAEQNGEVERKNAQVEQARASIGLRRPARVQNATRGGAAIVKVSRRPASQTFPHAPRPASGNRDTSGPSLRSSRTPASPSPADIRHDSQVVAFGPKAAIDLSYHFRAGRASRRGLEKSRR
jgi:hypothetical protein